MLRFIWMVFQTLCTTIGLGVICGIAAVFIEDVWNERWKDAHSI